MKIGTLIKQEKCYTIDGIEKSIIVYGKVCSIEETLPVKFNKDGTLYRDTTTIKIIKYEPIINDNDFELFALITKSHKIVFEFGYDVGTDTIYGAELV